jgi:uncharacterized membrane protein HdeD (DUF308 family)
MRFTIFANWWALAGRGTVAALFGVTTVLLPGLPVAPFGLLFGAFAVAEGACNATGAVRAARIGERRWPLLAGGLVGMAIGAVGSLWPEPSATSLARALALWSIATGAFDVVAAAHVRKALRGEWLLALRGAVSVAFGLWLAADGGRSAAWRAFSGVYAAGSGAALIALSLRLRSLRPAALRAFERLLPDFLPAGGRTGGEPR